MYNTNYWVCPAFNSLIHFLKETIILEKKYSTKKLKLKVNKLKKQTAMKNKSKKLS